MPVGMSNGTLSESSVIQQCEVPKEYSDARESEEYVKICL